MSVYGGVHDYDLVSLGAADKNIVYSNIQIVKDTDRYPIITKSAGSDDWPGSPSLLGTITTGLLLIGCCLSCHNISIDIIHQAPDISECRWHWAGTDRTGLAFILSILCTLSSQSVVQQTDSSWRAGKSIIVLWNLDKILVWLWLRNPTAISPSEGTICLVILGLWNLWSQTSLYSAVSGDWRRWRLGPCMARQQGGQTEGRLAGCETVRLWWLFWPSHQTQSSSGSPGRLGCQHNIMSFFKTSSSRHGLGQIVHLANKDLIIISVVIRIKWTEEKIASWLNHQSDFKPPTEYQCSLRVQRY